MKATLESSSLFSSSFFFHSMNIKFISYLCLLYLENVCSPFLHFCYSSSPHHLPWDLIIALWWVPICGITVVRSAILLKYRRWRHSKTHWFPIALRLSVGHSSKNAVQSQFWPGFITSDTIFYYPWLAYKVQWLWLASHSSIMLHPLYLLFNLPGTFSSSISAQLISSHHSRPLAKYLPETSPLTVLR